MSPKYIIYLLVLLLFASCSRPADTPGIYGHAEEGDAMDKQTALAALAENPHDIEALASICSILTTEGDLEAVGGYSATLRMLGDSLSDERAAMYGANYMGQTYLLLNKGDSIVYFLEEARQIAEKLEDLRMLSSSNNALGIYYVDVEMDYHKGLSYFMDAIEYGQHAPHKRSYPIALCNLAMTYYMRNDPAGLGYALEAYGIGHKIEDSYLIFSSAGICAYMYYLLGDYQQALHYVEEALPYVEKHRNAITIYSLYGNILYAQGSDAKAEHYYRMSLENIETERIPARAMAYLNYATYLMGKGKYWEAIPLLEKGISVSNARNSAAHRQLLYEKASEAYQKVGDKDRSLEYFKIYHQESDSIFNVERERSINELRVKYEAEKKENEIRQNRIVIIQEQKKLQVAVLIMIVILTALAATYLMYKRQNNMYRQIVRQQHEFLKKEKRLKDKSEGMPVALAPDTGHGAASENVKNEELFMQIEHLMHAESIYKEKDLTIDKLSERLNTNRTYLSRTINQQAGMSFNNYINTYRINEAVKILSDTDNDIPLKAVAADMGFNHIQTFYKAFQNTIGMPPLKYREMVVNMYKKKA